MKISSSGCTLSILLIVLAIFLVSQVARAELPQEIDLTSNSFSLSADVAIEYTYGLRDFYKVEEIHSNWQLRSRVDYQIEGPLASYLASRGTIFSDDTPQAFNVMRALGRCEPIDLRMVDQALNKDFVRSLFFTHKLGTARMLIWLGENSDKFAATAAAESHRFEATLEGGFNVSVTYAADTSLPALPLGVPSQVLVQKTGQYAMLYKFKRVVALKPFELIFGGSSSGARHGSNDLLFDMLAVDRGLGCASDSKGNAVLSSTLADTERRYRFSFRARYEAEAGRNDEPIEMTVGYEPELAILRTDRTISSRSTHTLVSYRQNRIYHLLRRRQARDAVFSIIASFKTRQVTGDDRDQPPVSCVVMQAKTGNGNSSGNPHSLGEMLLGANKVTYLGLARVRGIEAFAFEAHESRPPVWLEQPSVYEALAKSGYSERLRENSPVGLTTLTSVLYFSRCLGTCNMILGNRLLLIELSKTDASTGERLSKVQIPIYDFTWQARAMAPSGERTEDFYSLKDECLSGATGDNHYAQIEMALKGADSSGGASVSAAAIGAHDWLRVGVTRNLALVCALREQLHVPATLVYDVQSRYTPLGAEMPQRANSLVVSLRAAERRDDTCRLIFLGRGYLRRSIVSQVIVQTALSFQSCYQMASHTRRDTLFAFNSHNNKCRTYRGEAPTRANLQGFVLLDSESPVEIFKVTFQDDQIEEQPGDYISALDELHERLADSDRLVLVDPNELNPKFRQDTMIYFGLRDLQVEHLNEKTPYELDGQHLYDTNKFPGLGLIAQDAELNKLVETRSTSGAMGMTFEQCHTACFIDPVCRSFSTCIVEGQIECVLSSVDFRESTLALQLMELLEKPGKLGELTRVTLQAENVTLRTINIKKHPTCELHNKFYGDLFTSGGKSIKNLQDYPLQPVTTHEKCAEICFNNTLNAMRQVQSVELDDRPVARSCSGYFYLDKQLIKVNNLTIRKNQLVGRNLDGATRGYCAFYPVDHLTPPEIGEQTETTKQQLVQVRTFDFDHLFLFEKHYGVSLAESSMTSEEHEAYGRVSFASDKVSQEDLSIMKSFLDHGGNTGIKFLSDSPSNCARRCFMQVDQLWPACRSFEFMEIIDKFTAEKMSFCLLNTATMRDLLALGKADTIERDGQTTKMRVLTSDESHVWHYEPRQGYIASSLEHAYRVILDYEETHLVEYHKATELLHINSISLFLMLTVALVAGLTVGFQLFARIATNRLSPTPIERESILVENPARESMKFQDMARVDSDENGHIE